MFSRRDTERAGCFYRFVDFEVNTVRSVFRVQISTLSSCGPQKGPLFLLRDTPPVRDTNSGCQEKFFREGVFFSPKDAQWAILFPGGCCGLFCFPGGYCEYPGAIPVP